MTRATIGDAERTRREREVGFARGSVCYEGRILSAEVERLNARYIDSDELAAAILASGTVRHG